MLVAVFLTACLVLTGFLVWSWVRWARGPREPRGFEVLPPKERDDDGEEPADEQHGD
jgi:hypothetical protein